GDNPPDAAVINYYQRDRHLFGRLKLEVLDASGRVIHELPANRRPGLIRVTWPMRAKPPRVPPAAQIASAGERGPRLVPGEYTDQLYGAILSYEGKPGGYQIAYLDTLKRELADATKEFDQLLAQDLPALNESLKAKGQQPVPAPPAKVGANDVTRASGGAPAITGLLSSDFWLCQ